MKPIQTGLESCQGDTETVQELTNLLEDRFERPQIEPQHSFVLPWRAAIKENKPQTKVNEIAIPAKFLNSSRPLIIEGVGAYMFQSMKRDITDLILHFDIPVILVTRSGLGTINHTLLSLEHLKNRGIHKVYVVINGPINTDNAEAIKDFPKELRLL